jgi:hypothetical protein
MRMAVYTTISAGKGSNSSKKKLILGERKQVDTQYF